MPSNLESHPWLLPAAVILLLLTVWLLYRLLFRRGTPFEQALKDIAFDRVEGLVIPSADEGEIIVDHLLLTAQGLLILDVKDVRGNVFGGDKMQEWTVISDERRYTFRNPQPALYDRLAAVRQIVRQIPVEGRLLFLDGAAFTKGVPAMVCTLQELRDAFGEPDKDIAKLKVEALKPHWELLRERAVDGAAGLRSGGALR